MSSRYENAIEFKLGHRRDVTQEERLLADFFPITTLGKWASYRPAPATGLRRLKAASSPHRSFDLLLQMAGAYCEGDLVGVNKIARSLGDELEDDGQGYWIHRETGFRLRHGKEASTLMPPPTATPPAAPTEDATGPDTGPEAIAHALSTMSGDAVKAQGQHILRRGGKTARPRAIAMLNLAEGLSRNGLSPKDLLVTKVPVIPAQFRPTTIVGDKLTMGDANELYRDLIHTRDAYKELHAQLGDEGTGDDKLRLMDAVRATYGYGEPTNPKTRARGTTGFLTKITGKGGPKTGFVQQKLLAKPQDTVGRSVITPDPDLGLDEISIPWEMGWKMYAPYIQRKLVQSGMSPMDALDNVQKRTDIAKRALLKESDPSGGRPLIYSRAPSWHRFNVIAGYPKFHDGDHIAISPFVTAGMGADFDGDQINVHVPATEGAMKDAREKLLASKMLHSVRDFTSVIPVPKHEMVWGLVTAGSRPAKAKHVFKTKEEAVKAIKAGKVRMSDEVEIES